jgi:leader peptidase (prepilin peptidase) / N-methyltransferase
MFQEVVSEIPLWFFAIFWSAFGLAVGSFLNVVIYRVPLAKSIVSPSSFCPSCNTNIKPWHNIPLISWIILNKKCAYCSEPISIRYPIVELMGGLVAVITIFKFGISWEMIGGSVMGWFLIAIAAIDFDSMTVPDQLVLPMFLSGTLIVFLEGGVDNLLSALLSSTIAAIFFGLVWGIAKLIRGSEGLGTGDITASVAIAIFLHPILLPFALLVASTSGLFGAVIYATVKKIEIRGLEMPFAPSLAIGGWLTYLFGPDIINLMVGFL